VQREVKEKIVNTIVDKGREIWVKEREAGKKKGRRAVNDITILWGSPPAKSITTDLAKVSFEHNGTDTWSLTLNAEKHVYGAAEKNRTSGSNTINYYFLGTGWQGGYRKKESQE